MPLVTSYNSDSTEGKMLPTINGVSLFTVGPFFSGYGTGYTVANSTTESSIIYGSAAATTTAIVPTASAAWAAVNLSSDPTGKGPGSSVYLPGSAQSNIPAAQYGALVPGSIISGMFMGTVGITSTPTIAIKIYFRNYSTGAVAYTLLNTSTGWSPAAGGFLFEPYISVAVGGCKGSIVSMCNISNATSGYTSAPTVTTVDCTQSYLIDISFTWSAANSSNTFTIYNGSLEYLA